MCETYLEIEKLTYWPKSKDIARLLGGQTRLAIWLFVQIFQEAAKQPSPRYAPAGQTACLACYLAGITLCLLARDMPCADQHTNSRLRSDDSAPKSQVGPLFQAQRPHKSSLS